MVNSDSHYCAVRKKKKKEEDRSVPVFSTQLEVEQKLPADPNASPQQRKKSCNNCLEGMRVAGTGIGVGVRVGVRVGGGRGQLQGWNGWVTQCRGLTAGL